MAPKKNKKGNKLARMNDEEKLRYLQHRAAIEEETRRRKEHLVATYLKVTLTMPRKFETKILIQLVLTTYQVNTKRLLTATRK